MLAATALLVLASVPGVLAAVGGASNNTEPELPKCGAFAELKCASRCPRTCVNKNPVCDEDCIPNTCECIEGYALDYKSNACIKVDRCDRGPVEECLSGCRANGGFFDCRDGTKCDSSCDKGFLYRMQNKQNTLYCGGNSSNEYMGCPLSTCVPNEVCTKENEIYRECGKCEATCGDLVPSCRLKCRQECVCKEGFYRDTESGECVEKCCPRITCDEERQCDDDMIEVEVPAQYVDGCKVTCNAKECLPKYIEDGAPCGGDVPGMDQMQCRYPSKCLVHDFNYLPLGGPREKDSGAVCGRYGTRIVYPKYLKHLATNGVRVCDRACEENDECVAWQYRHRGYRRSGYCALLKGYNERCPYFSFYWFTYHYVSAVKL